MIERSELDILRAYRVYKSADIIKKRISADEDLESFVIVCAFVALYNGITVPELLKVLPIQKNYLDDILRKAVKRYGILNFDGSVVIGHRFALDRGSKGVLTLSESMWNAAISSTKSTKVSRRTLKAFAAVLSNSAAHTIIMKENIKSVDNAGVLKHIFMFWLALLDNSLYYNSCETQNLTRIGYMRVNQNNKVEINKKAVFYEKEPQFAIRPIR